MAKGEIHLRWWKRMLPLSIIISLILMTVSPLFGIMMFMGYIFGNLIEPDLDQIGLSSSEGRAMRKFGCLGVIWVGAWLPYAYIFPHRSFWSHFPVVSDLLRLMYLLIVPVLVLIYFQYPISNTMLLSMAGIVSGLSLSTTVHYILDK